MLASVRGASCHVQRFTGLGGGAPTTSSGEPSSFIAYTGRTGLGEPKRTSWGTPLRRHRRKDPAGDGDSMTERELLRRGMVCICTGSWRGRSHHPSSERLSMCPRWVLHVFVSPAPSASRRNRPTCMIVVQGSPANTCHESCEFRYRCHEVCGTIACFALGL